MKQLPWRKLSILGVVLTVASVVTAAVIPSNNVIRADHDGSLTNANTTDGNTCTTSDETKLQLCSVDDATLSSAAAGQGLNSTDGEGNDTENNTEG